MLHVQYYTFTFVQLVRQLCSRLISPFINAYFQVTRLIWRNVCSLVYIRKHTKRSNPDLVFCETISYRPRLHQSNLQLSHSFQYFCTKIMEFSSRSCQEFDSSQRAMTYLLPNCISLHLTYFSMFVLMAIRSEHLRIPYGIKRNRSRPTRLIACNRYITESTSHVQILTTTKLFGIQVYLMSEKKVLIGMKHLHYSHREFAFMKETFTVLICNKNLSSQILPIF